MNGQPPSRHPVRSCSLDNLEPHELTMLAKGERGQPKVGCRPPKSEFGSELTFQARSGLQARPHFLTSESP